MLCVTPAQCFATTHSWACIDPTVMIDDDGQAWLVWGNRKCYYAKLKKNMVELDGPVKTLDIDLKDMPFEEGPWIFKHNGRYYLIYACGNPEKLAYAIGDKVDGHFEAKGILMERSGTCSCKTHSIQVVCVLQLPYDLAALAQKSCNCAGFCPTYTC